MTTDKIREKAIQMLASRDAGRRIKASIVVLNDGSSFTGVLTARSAAKAGQKDAAKIERLAFTLSDDEVRYFAIDDIVSL